MNNVVFVYGTLKQGYSNHAVLRGAIPLGKAKTTSQHTLIDWGAFPAVVLEGDTEITGEAYRVDEEIFGRLDSLEGYPTFYNRKQIELDNGMDAWMYYIPEEDVDMGCETVVESGEWGCY